MTKAAGSTVAVRVTYTGRVQGVGFRYAVARLAKEYSILGWVRNAFDGSVEMVAIARPEELEAFLNGIQDRMRQYIRNVHQEPTAPAPHLNGFEIRL
jgi:acylphosphatase